MLHRQRFQINLGFCSELRSGHLPWKEHSVPGIARSSRSSRGRIPVLTWLCLFSLVFRASLPFGLEQPQMVAPGSAQLRALPLHAQRLRLATGSLPPGEFKGSWKTRNTKGGAEAQLSTHIHTHSPCCRPSPESRG